LSAPILVIVNPASAGGRTARQWPRVAALLRTAGIQYEAHHTRERGEATTVAREALRSGRERIVAVGGDGTLNEVLNGFFDEHGKPLGDGAVLGVIPSGTGGDFRKSAAIPRGTAEAVALLSSKAAAIIDAGRLDFGDGTRRHFINIADCGIGGEVVARVNRNRFKGGGSRGTAVFLWESMAALMTFGGRPVRVSIDGERYVGTVQSVVVANGRFFGGGMHVAPRAVLDDGAFDVVIVESMGRLRSLSSMPSLYRGRHLGRPGVIHRRATVVGIEAIDDPLLFDVEGEQVGQTPAVITCLPGAITLCATIPTGGR
jgi:YegS/Rv2252/BmrU family lipid kinase